MVWSEVKTGQEVGPDDGLFDVGNYEGKWEYLVSDSNSVSYFPVARDGSAIGGG